MLHSMYLISIKPSFRKTIGRSAVFVFICQSVVLPGLAEGTPLQTDGISTQAPVTKAPIGTAGVSGKSISQGSIAETVRGTTRTNEPSVAGPQAPSNNAEAALNEPFQDLNPREQKQGPTRILAAANVNDGEDQQLESLTTQIARKETELLRLNTNFRIECTRVSKWKPWRLFFYNLAASGSSNAGITSITSTRWHYRAHPKAMARSTAWSGPVCLLVGHCISLGGVLTETTLDVINDHKVKKKGFDVKSTHHRVIELTGELDRLVNARETVLAQSHVFTPSELELAKAEGSVLQDVRDLALNEYSQFFVRSHKFFGNRAASSLLAVTAASTGGFEGSLLGIVSAYKRRPKLVGPGGVGFIISGATIVATPATARLVANIRGGLARKKISSELNTMTTKSVSQLDADRAKLEQLASRSHSCEHYNLTNLSRRLSAYSKENKLFTAQNEINAREKASSNREFRERMLFATLIGGTKMSWGINLANAGFRFSPHSILQLTKVKGKVQAKIVSDPAPAKLFTRRVAIGATTYVPGTGLWIFDTLQNRIRGEMRNHTLASQKNLPGALLKERLDRVEEIDEVFNY